MVITLGSVQKPSVLPCVFLRFPNSWIIIFIMISPNILARMIPGNSQHVWKLCIPKIGMLNRNWSTIKFGVFSLHVSENVSMFLIFWDANIAAVGVLDQALKLFTSGGVDQVKVSWPLRVLKCIGTWDLDISGNVMKLDDRTSSEIGISMDIISMIQAINIP